MFSGIIVVSSMLILSTTQHMEDSRRPKQQKLSFIQTYNLLSVSIGQSKKTHCMFDVLKKFHSVQSRTKPSGPLTPKKSGFGLGLHFDKYSLPHVVFRGKLASCFHVRGSRLEILGGGCKGNLLRTTPVTRAWTWLLTS